MWCRTAHDTITNDHPVKIKSIPTIRPGAQNAVRGRTANIIIPSRTDKIPLNSTQPSSTPAVHEMRG